MRKSDLARFDTDWQQRGLFRKRNRLGKYLWFAGLVGIGIVLYQARLEIPDLLLDSFKLIAHMVPDQHTGAH